MDALRHEVRTKFWQQLTRQMNANDATEFSHDSKRPGPPTIFLPADIPDLDYQRAYYGRTMTVRTLPADRKQWGNLIDQAGILGLAWHDNQPLPYIVPGGRFNEFYGWDSYFIARGLINDDYPELAACILEHFVFEIKHYGRVLNANRPYYLNRAQPPFVTDLAWRLRHNDFGLFVRGIKAAIQEYNDVWLMEPRIDPNTGLSKYCPEGSGFPPEVEPGHFNEAVEPYARAHGMSVKEYVESYSPGRDPDLDRYLRNDRAVRESGHDVSTRLVGRCAEMATIDLNCLLYKYELDIFRAIQEFPSEFASETAPYWSERAERRRNTMTRLMWTGKVFSDYYLEDPNGSQIMTPTILWALWSGLATTEQASVLVPIVLDHLECAGGLASSERISAKRTWQWDHPAGWAPHQILAWEGLVKYGFIEDAQRLARKWLKLVGDTWHETGEVYEKYDVVDSSHNVDAEYGNQGSAETGFGWTNASISCAQNILSL